MLRTGARIAVIAPSGAFDAARLARGVALVTSWGYRVEVLEGASSRWRYLAGTDETRLCDLHFAFSGAYDAVWMARGGYGIARLLPMIDWNALAPVPFFGFSDGTGLLNALVCRGRPAVHAPVLHSLAELDEASQTRMRELLAGADVAPIAPGLPNVPVRGGNLCVLASLCGTAFQLDARGAIVLLEDLGEVPYKLDRLTTQLLLSGALDGAVGVVCGDMLDAAAPDGADWAVRDLFEERLGSRLLAWGVPVGHGLRNHAMRFS